MKSDRPFVCPRCQKQCRIVYEEPSGAINTVTVKHSCGEEIARAVANREIEFYEMGDDKEFHRSQSFTTHDFYGRCQCWGSSCEHHSPEQPCPNEAVPPIGLCEACHAANREDDSTVG